MPCGSASVFNARLQTASGILYKLVSGPKFSIGEDGRATATEEILILGVDLDAFISESLPPPRIVNGFIYKPNGRALPGAPLLITRSIEASPFSGEKPGDPLLADLTAPIDTYEGQYLLTVTYGIGSEDQSEPDPQDPETFLEYSVNAAGEFLNVSPKNICIDDRDLNGLGTQQQVPYQDQTLPVSKMIPLVEHNLRWKYAVSPNWPVIVQCLGRVNSTPFKFRGFNSPPETVLFAAVTGHETFLWTGSLKAPVKITPMSLDFKFLQRHVYDGGRQYGWQHSYIPDIGWRRIITTCGSQLSLYVTTDFQNIWGNVTLLPTA